MFDVALCIPSFNEAANIAQVTRVVDIGLHTYFPKQKAIIVNADNRSADGTSEAFLSIKTHCTKEYIATHTGVTGKGENLSNFFQWAVCNGVQAAATVDADLESIRPEWIRELIAPVLDRYDFVFPSYDRNRYDGAITSQLCYPLIAGICGIHIRQPIGGEFGFSRRFLDFLVRSPIPVEARGFGIDIFLTMRAVCSDFALSSVSLGRKIHRKRDRATLKPMCREVASALFSEIKRVGIRRDCMEALTSPPIKSVGAESACPAVPVNTALLHDLFRSGFQEHFHCYQRALNSQILTSLLRMCEKQENLSVPSAMWCDIVFSVLRAYLDGNADRETVAAAIVPAFFARLISFIQETQVLSDAAVEAEVVKQAELFFAHRGNLETCLQMPALSGAKAWE